MSTSKPGSTLKTPGLRSIAPAVATSSSSGLHARAGRSSAKPVVKKKVTEAEIVGWLGGEDFVLPQSKPVGNSLSSRPQIPVRSGAVISDEEIARLARGRVEERNHPGFQEIELEVQNRVMFASGNVRSKGERVLLVHILKQTPHVEKVIDRLTVGKAADFVAPKSPRTPVRLPEFNFSVSLPTLELPSIPFKPLHVGAVLTGIFTLSLLVWSTTGSQAVAVHRVTGRVVMEGEALPQASVVLHPVGNTKLPKGLTPHATAKDDGGFAVATFSEADGAPEGEFIATVHLLKPVVVDGDTIPGPNVLPEVYSRPETSPFRVNISRDTKELAVLELHKSSVR